MVSSKGGVFIKPMDKERKTFLFFCSWAEVLADFTPTDRCSVYDAAIAYAENGTIPSLSPVLMMAFKFIKKDIDEMQTKYETICERNRENARKRWQRVNATASESIRTQPTASEKCECMHHKHEHEHNHEHGLSNESNNNIEKETTKVVKKKTAECFIAPTIDEVQEYATQKGYSIDAEHFVDYYTANGWRVGRNPMKDWRAAVRTWVTRYRGQAQPQRTQSLGVGEYINAKGIRTYGNSGQAVPPEAPPRPSEAHWWSDASQRWENML